MRGSSRLVRPALFVGALAAVALSTGRTGTAARSAQSRWIVTDLGRDCSAHALNERGQIVGVCGRGDSARGVLWWHGKETNLGRLRPDLVTEPGAINDRGQVVGVATRVRPNANGGVATEDHAFIWENGRIRELTAPGATLTDATAINNRGQILGYGRARPGAAPGHLFWDAGRVTAVPLEVWAMNDRGQVVGHARNAKTGSEDAYIWENGQMRDLGSLADGAGGRSTFTSAVDINDRGQVVGISSSATGAAHPPTHAFLWQNGRMTDLTPSLGVNSDAEAVNERGQVIGSVDWTRTSETSFLWEDGRMTRLDPPGSRSLPIAIDDEGRVICQSDPNGPFVWESGRRTSLDANQVVAIDHGRIIGQKTDGSGHTHARLWTLTSGA